MVIGIGPAGTGKTYLAVARAVEALYKKRVKRIILARPAVEAGERYDGHDGGTHAVPEPETSADGTGPRRASESSTS